MVYTEAFLDTTRVTLSGVTQSVNTPTKDASNPLFPTSAETDEWDEDKLYVSTTNLDGLKMHYRGVEPTTPNETYRWGYAESVDGTTWTKPNLGLVSYDGNTDNNILFDSQFIHTRYDDESDKWVALNEPDFEVWTSDSPDGGFTLAKTLTPATSFQSELKSLVRRPPDGRWVAYYSNGHATNERAIHAILSDSTDLTGDWTDRGIVIEDDGSTNQAYSLGVSAVGGVIYGLADRYNSTSGQLWIDLFCSLNGLDWVQVDANWIDVGAAWDDEMACFSGKLTTDGDTWHVYYSGSPEVHSASFPRDSRIGRATIDRERIGQVSGSGTATTPYFIPTPGTFRVNADASGGGSLDIEVQDQDGNALPDFASEDFDTIITDGFDHTPTWGGKTIPSPLAPVRFVFTLDSATLYAFELDLGRKVGFGGGGSDLGAGVSLGTG